MKYTIKPTSLFQKDLKHIQKRGYDINLLTNVIKTLARGDNLSANFKDHKLSGIYKNCRECHITSDWLLIYEIKKETLYLYLTRTGSHSDLFKN